MSGFKVSYKLNLVPSIAAYDVTITSQRPIDTVLLQSTQQVDILSFKDKVCKENRIKDEEGSEGYIINGSNKTLTTLKIDAGDVK